MTRNGEQQDITVMPVNSQPIMVVQIGSGDNIELIRWGINTVIEYYTASTGLWNVGTVLSPNSIKDEKTQETINLSANTPVRLRDTPTISGTLVLSTKMYDIEYNAEDLQTAYQFLYGSGIVRDKLYGNIFASGGRQITVQSAMFVIDGFVGFFQNPQSLTADVGDGSPRKDLLVLRKVQSEGDVYLAIKRGIPSANPVAPTLTKNTNGVYEIGLAEITVQANSTTIIQSDIKDIRETLFVKNIYSRPFTKDIIVASPAGNSNSSAVVSYTFQNRFQGTIRYYDLQDPKSQIRLSTSFTKTQSPPVISDIYGSVSIELYLKSPKIPNWNTVEKLLSIVNSFYIDVKTSSTVKENVYIYLFGSRYENPEAFLKYEMPFTLGRTFEIGNNSYFITRNFNTSTIYNSRSIEYIEAHSDAGTSLASERGSFLIKKNEIPFTAEAGETIQFLSNVKCSSIPYIPLKVRIEGLEYMM